MRCLDDTSSQVYFCRELCARQSKKKTLDGIIEKQDVPWRSRATEAGYVWLQSLRRSAGLIPTLKVWISHTQTHAGPRFEKAWISLSGRNVFFFLFLQLNVWASQCRVWQCRVYSDVNLSKVWSDFNMRGLGAQFVTSQTVWKPISVQIFSVCKCGVEIWNEEKEICSVLRVLWKLRILFCKTRSDTHSRIVLHALIHVLKGTFSLVILLIIVILTDKTHSLFPGTCWIVCLLFPSSH